jgi:hypothetical protein
MKEVNNTVSNVLWIKDQAILKESTMPNGTTLELLLFTLTKLTLWALKRPKKD